MKTQHNNKSPCVDNKIHISQFLLQGFVINHASYLVIKEKKCVQQVKKY